MNGLRDDRLRADLADLAEVSRAVDLYDRVLVRSRRARIRDAVAGAAVLAVLAAAGVGAALWVRPGGAAGPADGARPTTTLAGDPMERVTVPTGTVDAQPAQVVVFGDPGPLPRGTVLDLPAWPGRPDCPSGQVELVKAGHLAGGGKEADIVKAVAADVDGDGSADLVANVECSGGGAPTYQVIAVGDVGGSDPRTLGQVVAAGADSIGVVYDIATRTDGSVRVTVGDRPANSDEGAQVQSRTYTWRDGAFAQTGGPEAFPVDPAAPRVSVHATVTAGTSPAGEAYVTVAVSADNRGSAAAPDPRLLFAVPTHLVPVGLIWSTCVMDESGRADGYVLLQCPLRGLEENLVSLGNYRFLVGAIGDPPNRTVTVAILHSGFERDLRDNTTDATVP